VLSRSRQYKVGVWMALGIWIAATFGYALSGQSPNGSLFVFATYLPLVFALGSILLSPQRLLMVLTGILLGVAAFPLLQPEMKSPTLVSVLGTLISLGVLTLVAQYYRDANERDRMRELSAANSELKMLRKFLEQRVDELNRAHETLQQTQTLLLTVIDQIPAFFWFRKAGACAL
jgi:hypothetical protein